MFLFFMLSYSVSLAVVIIKAAVWKEPQPVMLKYLSKE